MSDYRAKPPLGLTPPAPRGRRHGLRTDPRRHHFGPPGANERLVVADLAGRHHSSSNPVREALQLLRGQGFVTLRAQSRRAGTSDRPGFCARHLRDRGGARTALRQVVRRDSHSSRHCRAREPAAGDGSQRLRRSCAAQRSRHQFHTLDVREHTTTGWPPRSGGETARCCGPSPAATASPWPALWR